MTSKFLNISTDTTLGGSSASDNTVASQKAVKAYADTKQDTITSSNKLSASLVSGLATVATTGSYNDLSNKPTIPTVNNATLTIQKNGSNVATFTANASSNVTANISVPNVTSTYTATGTDAVNGMAVSNAIATKQDNLVSGTNIKTINGNSLLGSGNITIETSSTPNVDGETISYNSSDALQAIAVKNVRDGSTLPIWHGTEYQWNHGDPTTWYYWQTSATALWTSGGTLPSGITNNDCSDITYGNGMFVLITTQGNVVGTTDNGNTWNILSTLPTIDSQAQDDVWFRICYGNGKFVVICKSGYELAYSTDNCQTWTKKNINLPRSISQFIFANNKFVINCSTGTYGYTCYSEDLENWSNLVVHRGGIIGCGNGRYIGIASSGTYYWAQSQDLETWENIRFDDYLYFSGESPIYVNGKFLCISNYDKNYLSTLNDNSNTWDYCSIRLPISNAYYIKYGDNKIMIANDSGECCYSTDEGNTWTKVQTPFNTRMLAYGNDIFISNGSGTPVPTAKFAIQYDKCYTTDQNPTTTSVVYSEPETVSSYTISSVTSGAITLSNNNTYYYNQSGNVQTYQTVGDAHPEYLCFIDGVGVKMGNTFIATNNSNS